MIASEAAVHSAEQGIKNLELDRNPDVAASLATGHIGDVILVTRLDTPGNGYYLVTWVDKDGIRLLAQVDAVTGALASVVPVSQPLARLMIDADEARQLVTAELGWDVTDEPQVIWTACRESASPFQPFYQFVTTNGLAFVRADGALFTELMPFRKGG